MNRIAGTGWINNNSSRNYPFVDSANLSIASDGFIPNDFIVDARIYMRNTYQASRPAYISSLQVLADKVIITLACDRVELGKAELPYSLTAEQQPNEDKGTYFGPDGSDLLAVCSIKQNNVMAGVLVINVPALNIIQSLEQKLYSFAVNQLEFVAAVCDYLPGPQVTSINQTSGEITLRGETGILVEKTLDGSSTIKISIVGDSHFTRSNCVENPLENEVALFLEQLTVIHYSNPEPNASLNTSRLKVMNIDGLKDGSIDFSLMSKVTRNNALPLNERPAFRVTVEGNTIKLSMAGG